MQEHSLFWFRRDLRLKDNHGLLQALKSGRPVCCVYIFDANELSTLPKDDKKVHFIYSSLLALKKELEAHGSSLDIRFGDPAKIFPHLIRMYNFKQVFANHDYDAYSTLRDAKIGKMLLDHGIKLKTFKDSVIFEKRELLTSQNEPYTLFLSYAKRWKEKIKFGMIFTHKSEDKLINLAAMSVLQVPSLKDMGFNSIDLMVDSPNLEPNFLRLYEKNRDLQLIKSKTSKASPYLKYGLVSIRFCVNLALTESPVFLEELIWREFFTQSLSNFPETANNSFKRNYDNIKWDNSEAFFKKWCEGKTGFPLVDAAMRQLNSTGFIEYRLRILVASFLCKNLCIEWQKGERYFASKLLDYDQAINVGNWQWIAGSGVDAAPYFKIYNPAIQQDKFDPLFLYVKQWVPEYKTPEYPNPIVNFADSRDNCFKMYKKAIIPT